MPDGLSDIAVGPYRGCVAQDLRQDDFLASLAAHIPAMERSGARAPWGRNAVFRIQVECRGEMLDLCVKYFGAQTVFKDLADLVAGSPARRSWLVAEELRKRGIGTPAPVGFLETRRGLRLVKSCFITRFEDGIASLRDELIRLYLKDPVCAKIMLLLETVAAAVRSMHDAGVLHGDLGNQNIVMRRSGETGWKDVMFVDLNRARTGAPLSDRERARDISRLAIPSDFLRVFKEMYFRGVPPRGFQRWEAGYRRLYSWHVATRPIRHPVRSLLAKPPTDPVAAYPSERDTWVWDDRSVQAVSPFTAKERRRLCPMRSHLAVARATVAALPAVFSEYRRLKAELFINRVPMESRVGLSVGCSREDTGREIDLLSPMGKIPVLLRFYRHEGERGWDHRGRVAHRLRAMGHPVSVALVQDRKAVANPGIWASFADAVLGLVGDIVEWVEVGHAVNRSKWGIWAIREHRRLLEATVPLGEKYRNVKFMGPAAIDFEYPMLVAALNNVPEGLKFAALSHHLYVDRRGAPENPQAGFSAVEKFALARAIARWAPRCEDRLIISEANWPLKGAGVYSPVGSPYESPGPRFNDPSVSEEEYADYMIRYLLLAFCSGMVERVYWWRLAARGFGLVDDTDARHWRKRKAYGALETFLKLLEKGTFSRKLEVGGARLFYFSHPDGKETVVAYSALEPRGVTLPFRYSRALNVVGEDLALGGENVRISGSPLYFVGVVQPWRRE